MPSNLVFSFVFCLCNVICVAQYEDYSEIWPIPSTSYDEFYGNGVSVFDYDGDNIDNITVAQPYIGISGFQVIQNNLILDFFIPLPLNIKQLIWADFNNDGDKELFVSVYGGMLYLFDYSNEGLTEITDAFSSELFGYHYGASAGDYDNDGDLDLFITQYLNFTFGAPFENLLLRNDGDFMFTEVGESLGVNAATNNSFQSVWVDFNRDGWQDLYVINDKNVPNLFYQNNFGISFTEIAASNNTNVAMSCMSNSISDYNRDGFFDIFITDGYIPVLLKGDSVGMYSQVAFDVGFNNFQNAWGALWIDDDLDGWDDIHICQGGTVLGPLTNQYYQNNNGVFTMNNSFDTALKASFVNAKGDFDGDCIPDFITMNSAPISYDIWKGTSAGNNYIKLNLVGTQSNTDAAGAIIEAYFDGLYSLKVITMGDNYISQNSNSIFFGLGSAQKIDSLVVTWPLGLVETFYSIPVNYFYETVEGQNELVDLNTIAMDIAVCPPDTSYFIILNDNWEHWQWSNGQANNGQLVYSDTTLYAQAWNNNGQSFELVFNVTFSPPLPTLSIENFPCNDQESILRLENNTSWSSILNGTYFESDSLNLSNGIYFLQFVNDSGCASDTTFGIELSDTFTVLLNSSVGCADSLSTYSIEIQNEELNNFSLIGLQEFNGELWPGDYPFTLASNEGCEYSDTLRIIQRSVPQISLINDTLCLLNFSSGDFQTTDSEGYIWEFENYYPTNEPNLFTFEFEDNVGCQYEFTEYVFVADELTASVVEDTLENSSVLTIIPSEGVPPYTIIWDSFTEGTSFEVFPNTTVSFYVEDAIGCSIEGTYVTSDSPNYLRNYSNGLNLFFNGEYYDCVQCENLEYELYSATGNRVDYGRFNSPFKLNKGLPSGFYLLKIENYVFKVLSQP